MQMILHRCHTDSSATPFPPAHILLLFPLITSAQCPVISGQHLPVDQQLVIVFAHKKELNTIVLEEKIDPSMVSQIKVQRMLYTAVANHNSLYCSRIFVTYIYFFNHNLLKGIFIKRRQDKYWRKDLRGISRHAHLFTLCLHLFYSALT